MVLEGMHDMTPISGSGWRSVVRVRMLHSCVRLRAKSSSKYDSDQNGVAINQEDLLATLGAFSVAAVWSLDVMGILLTRREKDSYIAAWRHIGYYMGIEPAYLKQFFPSFDVAEKFLCSAIAHLLNPVPNQPSSKLPLQLIHGIKDRPLYGKTLEFHAALSRLLIGDELADIFDLSAPNTKTSVSLWISMALMKLPIVIGKFYLRPGWENWRRQYTEYFLRLIIEWNVGDRKEFRSSYYIDRTDRTRIDFDKDSDQVHRQRNDIKRKKWQYYTLLCEPFVVAFVASIMAIFIVYH